jgi:hypothetical protein
MASPHRLHAFSQKREPFLHLGPGEVRPDAVVDPRAKRQHTRAGTVGGDVERVVVDTVAVCVPGGHEHDRAGRECDPAVLDLVHGDAGGERRDRFVAEGLLDSRQRQLERVGAQRLPLVRVLSEEAHRVRKLTLARVDPADQDVENQVAQLVVR